MVIYPTASSTTFNDSYDVDSGVSSLNCNLVFTLYELGCWKRKIRTQDKSHKGPGKKKKTIKQPRQEINCEKTNKHTAALL